MKHCPSCAGLLAPAGDQQFKHRLKCSTCGDVWFIQKVDTSIVIHPELLDAARRWNQMVGK